MIVKNLSKLVTLMSFSAFCSFSYASENVVESINDLETNVTQLQSSMNAISEEEMTSSGLGSVLEQVNALEVLLNDISSQLGARLNFIEQQQLELQELPSVVMDLKDYVDSFTQLTNNLHIELSEAQVSIERLDSLVPIIESTNEAVESLALQVDSALESITSQNEQIVINSSTLSLIQDELTELRTLVETQQQDLERTSGAVGVLYSQSFEEGSSVVTDSFTLDEPGILLVQASGTANRNGSNALAGITMVVNVDGEDCAVDRVIEGPTRNITFHSSASCVVLLQPGIHEVTMSRVDQAITRFRLLQGSVTVLRLLSPSE